MSQPHRHSPLQNQPQAHPLNQPQAKAEAGLAPRFSIASRVLIALGVGFIKLYQITLSPFLGRHCRFHPTCSHYGIEALRIHGPLRGSWLTLKRLSRCHPFSGKGGYDPVPLAAE